MKKNFMLMICMNICLHVIAQSDVSTSKWMHVTADGNNKEWGSLSFYDDETQLNFGIANDSENIYLCFLTGTQAAEMKLMRAGMKITLSEKGQSKHEASIIFPLPQTKQQFKDSSFSKNNPPATGTQPAFNKETFRQNYIAKHTTMQVNGFTNANGEISTNDSDIHVAVDWDTSANMVYEIAIAKKAFFGAGYSAKDALNDITLNVELNGLSKSETGDAKNGKGGGAHGGFHGGMNGGGGTDDGGGTHGGDGFNGGGSYHKPQLNPMNSDDNVSLNRKTSFKQKFVLNDGSN